MSLGFNSNVDVGGAVYHVQTEDRGLLHPFVDTVVLIGGQVVHRRSASYEDLVDGAGVDESLLRERVEKQHQEILAAIRAGSLSFNDHHPYPIVARLCNPTSWLAGGEASLEIEVLSRAEQHPIAGVDVLVLIEGTEGEHASQFAAQTGTDGRARLNFRMPLLTEHAAPALVIRARRAGVEDQLRYRLRARSRDSAPPER